MKQINNLKFLKIILGLHIVLLPVSAYSGGNTTSADREVFKQSLKNFLPMSKDQIKKMKQRMNETKRTLREDGPPKMTSRSRELEFETGGDLPVVRIAPGYVTTMSFFDSTGQPWPLTSVTLGNPNYYSVKQPKGETNIITVSALKKYVDSNLAFTFQDQDMPATIQLKTLSGKKETDSLIVFKANGRGPNAIEPIMEPVIRPTIDRIMMSFLDLVPPGKAEELKLKPETDRMTIWSYRDSLYLRTEFPVLWPAWTMVTSGTTNGIRVYKLPKVTSLMVSRGGKTVSLDVESYFQWPGTKTSKN